MTSIVCPHNKKSRFVALCFQKKNKYFQALCHNFITDGQLKTENPHYAANNSPVQLYHTSLIILHFINGANLWMRTGTGRMPLLVSAFPNFSYYQRFQRCLTPHLFHESSIVTADQLAPYLLHLLQSWCGFLCPLNQLHKQVRRSSSKNFGTIRLQALTHLSLCLFNCLDVCGRVHAREEDRAVSGLTNDEYRQGLNLWRQQSYHKNSLATNKPLFPAKLYSPSGQYGCFPLFLL